MDCEVDREHVLPIEAIAERLPDDERHDVVEKALRVARIEQAEDVGVLQLGGEFDLAVEALRPKGRCQLGVEHLDRHFSLVLDVGREVDRSHASTPQLTLDLVTVLQR